MAKVLGLGGIFFRSRDPKALGEWYQKWLGVPFAHPHGASLLPASMPEGSLTVWAPFAKDTDYFGAATQTFMFNLIVDDLDDALSQVKEGGAKLAGDTEEYEYGRFAWFIDPDGNKVELWQP